MIMFFRNHFPIKLFTIFADLFSLGFSLFLSWYYYGKLNSPELYINPESHIIVVYFLWFVSVFLVQLYNTTPDFIRLMKVSVKSYFFFVSFIFAYLFIIDQLNASRWFIAEFLGVFGFLVIVTRLFVVISIKPLTRINAKKRVAIVGNSELSYRAAYYFSNSNSGYEFVGFFDDYSQYREGYQVIGNVDSCIEFAIKHRVDEIYSTLLPESNEALVELVTEAEKNFIRFKFIPDFNFLFHRNVNLALVGDIPVISFREEPLENFVNRINKRIFDLLFSLVILTTILWWLIPIISILIKIESNGPIFFIQKRSGRNNEIFNFYKFRSMYVNKDSDEKHADKNDSRITKVGKFLRKTSLDEIPQFLNVLKGDISVVGPRPHMLKHTQQYSKLITKFMVRHFLKPGITGWAQVNGYRGDVNPDLMKKRVELDIWYMENWSFWLDIKIVLKTVLQVIRPPKSAW